VRYADDMRYPDGGGLTAKERTRREPAYPGEPAYERVAEVVGRRGGADAGLVVTTG
jgi:hypothetical protein